MTTNIREIKRTSLLETGQRLRELGDEVDKREDIEGAIVVVCCKDGRVALRGYGYRTSALECIGWLHRALDAMTDGSGLETDFSKSTPPSGVA
jgi:hypothetical protein